MGFPKVKSERDALGGMAKLTDHEEKLKRECAQMQSEVARLKSLVQNAKADLEETERSEKAAGSLVDNACKSFTATLPADADVNTDVPSIPQEQSHQDPFAFSDVPALSEEEEEEEDAKESAPIPPKTVTIRRTSAAEKLGLFFSNNTTEITRVYPGFAGDRACLEPGWYIRRVESTDVFTLYALDQALQGRAQAQSFDIVVSKTPPPTLPVSPTQKRPQRSMVVVSPDAGVEEVEESEESEEDTDATDGEDDGFVVVRSEKSASSVGDPECATTDTPSKHTPATTPEVSTLRASAAPTTAAPAPVPTPAPAPAASPFARLDPSDIDIDSFRQFCKKYADDHPDMIAPEVPVEGAEEEERMRMQEDRRMRELYEDPTAMKELLMRTIGIMEKEGEVADPERNVVHQPAAAPLVSALDTDDWKRDYEARVEQTAALKAKWAERASPPPPPREILPPPSPPSPPSAQPTTQPTDLLTEVRSKRVASDATTPPVDTRNMKPSDVIALTQSGVPLSSISIEAAQQERDRQAERLRQEAQQAEEKKVEEWAKTPVNIDSDEILKYFDTERWPKGTAA